VRFQAKQKYLESNRNMQGDFGGIYGNAGNKEKCRGMQENNGKYRPK
jgi:hypothetical protein